MSNGRDLHRKADTNLKKKKSYFELAQGYLGMQTGEARGQTTTNPPISRWPALLPELWPPRLKVLKPILGTCSTSWISVTITAWPMRQLVRERQSLERSGAGSLAVTNLLKERWVNQLSVVCLSQMNNKYKEVTLKVPSMYTHITVSLPGSSTQVHMWEMQITRTELKAFSVQIRINFSMRKRDANIIHYPSIRIIITNHHSSSPDTGTGIHNHLTNFSLIRLLEKSNIWN